MPDILSQGGDRDPSPWPRRLVAIAVVIALATFLIVHLSQHHTASAQSPSAQSPPAQITGGPPAPGTSGSAPPLAGVAVGPDGIIGQTLRWSARLRLPVAGKQPTWFSPATGRMKPIDGLPRDSSGYQFLRIGGGWAIQSSAAARAGCATCADVPRPVYFLPDGAQSVTRVGTADGVAPAASAGALWLTSYPPGADQAIAAGTAQEVSVAGVTLGPQRKIPVGYVIDRATDHGLLLAALVQRPGAASYELWTPHSVTPFDGLIAASARKIAWTPRCTQLCRPQLLDLATGRRTAIRLPAGSLAASGAFSPDGDLLALQLSFRSNGDSGTAATQLEVASAATGRLTIVPGTGMSSDALVGFGWPAASDRLVAELSFTTKVQVASWRPGSAQLAVVAIRPGRNSNSLVVG
jgi:hypothetical protein